MTTGSIWTFIGLEVANTVIALCATAAVGGVVWLLTLHRKTAMLKTLLGNPSRQFILHFRGDEDETKKKTLKFQPGGTIMTPNSNEASSNEHYWEVRLGTLKIYTSGHSIYSKFKWDRKQGRLVHTNDPRLPSVMGQYIVPLFVPAAKNPSIYGGGQNMFR